VPTIGLPRFLNIVLTVAAGKEGLPTTLKSPAGIVSVIALAVVLNCVV